MSSKQFLGVWESFRYWAALSILLLILAFIPLLTLVNNSVQTNYIVAQAQLLFFVFAVKETTHNLWTGITSFWESLL